MAFKPRSCEGRASKANSRQGLRCTYVAHHDLKTIVAVVAVDVVFAAESMLTVTLTGVSSTLLLPLQQFAP